MSSDWVEDMPFDEAVKRVRLLDDLEDQRAARRRIAWQATAAAQDMAKALEWAPDAFIGDHLKTTFKHLWDLVEADQRYRKLREEAEVDEG